VLDRKDSRVTAFSKREHEELSKSELANNLYIDSLPETNLDQFSNQSMVTNDVSYLDDDTYDIGWIDDCRLTRECLSKSFIGSCPTYNITTFDSVGSCVENGRKDLSLILYFSHGSSRHSLDEIALLRNTFSETRLIIFSNADDITANTIRKVLTSGADGFVSTMNTSLPMAIAALHYVKAGGTLAPLEVLLDSPSLAGAPPSNKSYPLDITPSSSSGLKGKFSKLTTRQMDVVACLRQGKPNKLIAHELGLSQSTVKVHIRSILQRLGVNNRTHAATKALLLLLDSPNGDTEVDK
jgi:DNA-binding NarL/FixJ family response regulator